MTSQIDDISAVTPAPDAPAAQTVSYVDGIRAQQLVPVRKIPPAQGPRRWLFRISGGLINLGPSRDERRRSELEDKINSLMRGRYNIGVLGKGGVGKTTVAACIGAIFAEIRQGDQVVAIDADTGFSRLGARIDPEASGSYWELLRDQNLHDFSDVACLVGKNRAGLYVLPGEAATARRRVLDAQTYRDAKGRLDKHFRISVIDCGSTLDSEVTQAVLDDLDALIVVSTPWVDGAQVAAQTLELLGNNGHTALLNRTVIVLNDGDGRASKNSRAVLADQFRSKGQVVVELPFDPNLRPAGVIDTKNDIGAQTRWQLLNIAAAIAEHFPATTEGQPR